MPPVKNKASSPKLPPDLETRTSNFEDQVAIAFAVIACIITLGFVVWFWIQVLKYLLFWAVTMGLLYRSYEALGMIIGLYRKLRGLNHGRLSSISEKAAKNVVESGRFTLGMAGFKAGRGPLFDLLPEDLKRARRECKDENDVGRYLAFAGGSNEDTVDDVTTKDPNIQFPTFQQWRDTQADTGAAYVNPYDIEYAPNPVIFAEPQNKATQALDIAPVDTLVSPLEEQRSRMYKDDIRLRYEASPTEDTEHETTMPTSETQAETPPFTGPATNPATLAIFPCPSCSCSFAKAYKRSKHVNLVHAHRFKCGHGGCKKTFGLRTNLERHEATHRRDEQGLSCPNAWCKTPAKVFPRRDNLERHVRRCVP
ncbi:hypothetical protein BDW02DRAFT_125843 [Decorospora gaudefroyi]|uniref:C2H2-type domain-containing protein n=1 Tax=Decorospora gaudefroyi TaxID=184978 RepID=A0A6A5JZE8_9PLEO|nr:hypothetical protein BDW02DRAFT_125843 [Decorospora gaudefroyi]